jgi:hypothetical protein
MWGWEHDYDIRVATKIGNFKGGKLKIEEYYKKHK